MVVCNTRGSKIDLWPDHITCVNISTAILTKVDLKGCIFSLLYSYKNLFIQQTADMRLSDLPLSVYRQLAACLQQCSHGDGDDPVEPWWAVMALHLDITRQEQMDIGKFKISLLS